MPHSHPTLRMSTLQSKPTIIGIKPQTNNPTPSNKKSRSQDQCSTPKLRTNLWNQLGPLVPKTQMQPPTPPPGFPGPPTPPTQPHQLQSKTKELTSLKVVKKGRNMHLCPSLLETHSEGALNKPQKLI
ncbi:hypothetical protein E4T56_gene18122 [Termitomyces sp. T112]|nr:hypothetical protein E4T56_gene18122 [Termitomyces sp. T112]